MKNSGLFLLAGIFLLLSACAQGTKTPAVSFPSQTPIIETTPPTETATLSPSPSPSATPIKTATPKKLPIPAGLTAIEHPNSEYVFLVDQAVWKVESSPERPYDLLAHKTIPGCRVDLVPPMGPPLPEAFYQVVIGRLRWQVRVYKNTAIYGTQKPGTLYLFLDENQEPDCRAAQEKVLTNLRHASENAGGPAFTLAPIRRPAALRNFNCPAALAPRLRVNDNAYVIAESIFLRHSPDLKDSSQYRRFKQHAPVWISLLAGPVCVEEKYVFWQVSASPMSEGTTQWEGWLAESSPEEYYLELIAP